MSNILVLYNRPLSPKDHPAAESEHMIVCIAESMAAELATANYRTSLLALGRDPAELWRELERQKPDAILNLYEGTLDDAETESYVAGLLAWSGIPFTGCPPQTLSLARAKHIAKAVMKSSGLPTAEFVAVTGAAQIPAWTRGWPVMVKPAAQDASVGIEHASVCTNQTEMEGRVRHVLKTYGGPVLVEEFIDGREIIVAVTETPTLNYLPPAEILFPAAPQRAPGAWPILTYASKWKPGSADYEGTPPRYPADLPDELSRELGRIAMAAFRVFGCRDYARVDFRLRGDQPFLLELNPNPEISDDSCFGLILKSAGISFQTFLVDMIEQTLRRK